VTVPRRARVRRGVAVVVAAAALAAACGDDTGDDGAATDETTTTGPPTTAAPGPGEPEAEPLPEAILGQVELGLDEVARLEQPTAMALRPGSLDLYVTERRGTLKQVAVTQDQRTGALRHQLQSSPLLDLRARTTDDGEEQGLLGVTFSSDGRTLYLHHSRAEDGATRVVSYSMGDGTTVDASSERELLVVPQPFRNHNGGQLALGPDGFLYLALGDGGSDGDAAGNGQDTSTLLGSILRIDPEGAFGEEAYAVPPDNPFVDGGGAPEIWLHGVRNPWRFSFDAGTGDLWVADVGEDAWEEVTWLPAEGGVGAGRGANLGWNLVEGSHPFEGENPPDGVLPIHEYANDAGACSVTGGYVYRGAAIGALAGAYVFADHCAPGIRAIQVHEGQVIDERIWDLPATAVTSFGEGPGRELYVLSLEGPVWRLVPG
jgi:glucose/arabinose dehydrogenase